MTREDYCTCISRIQKSPHEPLSDTCNQYQCLNFIIIFFLFFAGEEEEKGTSLPKLMKSFSEVERLKGDNKYFCDNCNQLTEAERSLHYNVLPDVLSVHLKRFSTVSGLVWFLSW